MLYINFYLNDTRKFQHSSDLTLSSG